MLKIQVSEDISCDVDDLLEFVMDAQEYSIVDSKIRPVRWVERSDDFTAFGFRPRLLGLPGPISVAHMRKSGGDRIDISLAPAPANRLTRLVSDFTASFVCATTPHGTQLTRTLNFAFRPYLSWAAEPLARRRLTAEVEEEVAGVKRYFEQR